MRIEGNIYTLPIPLEGEEYFQPLLGEGEIVAICSCDVRNTQWYDQDHDEWVLLVQGEAELELKEGVIRLRAGEYGLIRAHERHRVTWTSHDALWIGVFIPRGSDPHGLDT